MTRRIASSFLSRRVAHRTSLSARLPPSEEPAQAASSWRRSSLLDKVSVFFFLFLVRGFDYLSFFFDLFWLWLRVYDLLGLASVSPVLRPAAGGPLCGIFRVRDSVLA